MIHLFNIPLRFLKIIAFVVLALVGAFVLFLGYLCIFRDTPLPLPAPTGSFPVGRIQLDWIDYARPDPLADQSSGPRELVVWVWYPANQSGHISAPYRPPAWIEERDRDQGIGVFVERSFSRIQTHSYEAVPLAGAPQVFPVLMMQPGMGPIVTDYTTLAENLASHGYIVVGLNPTGSSNWTVFPDGRVVRRTSRGTLPDNGSPETLNADASRILAVWAQDVRFGLDQLDKLNTDSSSQFFHHLDLAHVGIWGHSFGGATALSVCQTDARCQAGADLDGTPWGEERTAQNHRSFMFVTQDYRAGCDENCALMHQAFQNTSSGAYFISVAGAGHFNFSDLPYRQVPIFRPLFGLAGYEGSIDPNRALMITNAYLVAFFDRYLKGDQEPLLQGAAPEYPEVNFESH